VEILLAYPPGNGDVILPFEFLVKPLYQLVGIGLGHAKLGRDLIDPHKTVTHALFLLVEY
jgi:hypothetical protein